MWRVPHSAARINSDTELDRWVGIYWPCRLHQDQDIITKSLPERVSGCSGVSVRTTTMPGCILSRSLATKLSSERKRCRRPSGASLASVLSLWLITDQLMPSEPACGPTRRSISLRGSSGQSALRASSGALSRCDMMCNLFAAPCDPQIGRIDQIP